MSGEWVLSTSSRAGKLAFMQTPEFLLWALEYRCPIRGEQDGTDPERTERQLRGAREVSDARREGRVFEGLAVDLPNGFRVAEALAIYGGEEVVNSACQTCPANGCRGSSGSSASFVSSSAGCYGWVVLPIDPTEFHAAFDRVVPQAISGTGQRWYGMWLRSPLAPYQLAGIAEALQNVSIDEPRCRQGLAGLVTACGTALAHNLPLHIRAYPRGRVEGTWWRLVPHCPNCKAPWQAIRIRNATECVPKSAHICPTCEYVGHPAPTRNAALVGCVLTIRSIGCWG